MITVRAATADDVDAKVALERRLFAEDAGVHDPYGDVTWPDREGAADFEQLVGDDASLALIAFDDDSAVGLLVGYTASSSSTRLPAKYGTLRSLYVADTHRRSGVGGMLIDRFVAWAREAGCVEAHVDHYTANERAGRLYESCGFAPRSTSRVLPLD